MTEGRSAGHPNLVILSRSPDPERSEGEGEAKNLRDASLRSAGHSFLVILSEAKNLKRCFANAQHDKGEEMLRWRSAWQG